MKILAIRGKNLASLSSEFVVDFQSEPLASAGLFAITGPTGSGKSTLLDALCLALYEKTPRLTGVSRSGDIPDVGDNGISPGDVRTILRRNAAEGFAEVDFVGSDDIAYRSRWTVRRARNKADGKMQNTEVSLIRIADGKTLGDHRKTETLRLIEGYIGLSFEQFTRAVLLAQSDFSAFLKASDDERAELLQTLTGTEAFSAISIQAFERMKTEKELLLRLQVQLKDQEPLAPEIRSAKNAELQAQSDSAKILEQQRVVAESHLRWYEQWAQLKSAELDASQKLEAATANKVTAEPRYAQLALVDSIQPARPLWIELVRLEQAVVAATRSEELAKAAVKRTQGESTVRQAEHDTAQRQQAVAETVKAEAQYDIDSARELDASIVTITPQVEAAVVAHKAALDHLKAEHSRETEIHQRMETTVEELATARQWLADNAELRPLAEGWQLWEALFVQAQLKLESQSKVASQVTAWERAVVSSEHSLNTATVTLSAATKVLEADCEQLQVLSQECASANIDEVLRDKLALEEDRDQLQTALHLWQRRLETQKQERIETEQRQTHAGILAKSDSDLQEGMRTQPLLERELHAADESMNLAILAASESADSMRAALQSDKPCPVCGSVEHPYAAHAPAMDDLLKKLKDLVAAKRQALRALESGIATARATKATAERSIEQATLSLTQLASEAANLNAQWAAHSLQEQIVLVPESDCTQWLTERQDSVRRELEALTQQEALYRDIVKRKDAAQLKVNTATVALAQAKEALHGLDTKHRTSAQSLDVARNQKSETDQQLLAVESQIDGAFTSQEWREQWSKNPSAFASNCSENARAWNECQNSIGVLDSRMATLQAEISACGKACSLATAQLKTQTDARDAVESLVTSYRIKRSTMLDGRPVADVEAELSAAIQVAKAAWEASQTALHKAQAEVVRTMEASRQSAALLENETSSLNGARSNLDAWLISFNIQSRGLGAHTELEHSAVESLLRVGADWINGERDALQLLAHSLTTAKAVLATRSLSRSAHEAEKTVVEELDVLQERLAQLLVAIGSAAETLSALKLEIAKDDERLGASASLRVTIDKQAALSRVWSQLSELIGSADGKKFRNFAQQLTLDILLSYGNQHLQSLTRRYRLQRIKDSLGLLVVDQDMGDEVRSVHSLSGGESFLVSLALALGLASLSSHRVRVESLFIDEGFGSLDADSLGVAMDALDNLQSQGRKVGVISHVQEMTERIGTRVQVQRQAGGLSRIAVC